MGNRYRQPPSDIIRRTLDVTDRVGLLESAPRASNTSVDQGHWRFKASNGITMVDFGDQGPGFGSGFLFRRGNTGKPAFYLGDNQASGDQFWRLADNSGEDIISDDAASGSGLARPYLPIVGTRYTNIGAPAETTASTTLVGAYALYGYKQHPRMYIQYIVTTPAGVSAEIALVETASIPITLASNTHPGNSFTIGTLVAPISGAHLSLLNHDLQFRVSGGAGTIGVTLINAYGIQS